MRHTKSGSNFGDYSMADYIYYYGENTIKVSVDLLTLCSLYVNGELQDKSALWSSHTVLRGKLNSGEEVKLLFEGNFILKAKLFVGDKILEKNIHYPIYQKNAQQTPTNQTPVKEVMIIKEIVKIHCQYCHQLFDITADKCPNCSAKNSYYTR